MFTTLQKKLYNQGVKLQLSVKPESSSNFFVPHFKIPRSSIENTHILT